MAERLHESNMATNFIKYQIVTQGPPPPGPRVLSIQLEVEDSTCEIFDRPGSGSRHFCSYSVSLN